MAASSDDGLFEEVLDRMGHGPDAVERYIIAGFGMDMSASMGKSSLWLQGNNLGQTRIQKMMSQPNVSLGAVLRFLQLQTEINNHLCDRIWEEVLRNLPALQNVALQDLTALLKQVVVYVMHVALKKSTSKMGAKVIMVLLYEHLNTMVCRFAVSDFVEGAAAWRSFFQYADLVAKSPYADIMTEDKVAMQAGRQKLLETLSHMRDRVKDVLGVGPDGDAAADFGGLPGGAGLAGFDFASYDAVVHMDGNEHDFLSPGDLDPEDQPLQGLQLMFGSGGGAMEDVDGSDLPVSALPLPDLHAAAGSASVPEVPPQLPVVAQVVPQVPEVPGPLADPAGSGGGSGAALPGLDAVSFGSLILTLVSHPMSVGGLDAMEQTSPMCRPASPGPEPLVLPGVRHSSRWLGPVDPPCPSAMNFPPFLLQQSIVPWDVPLAAHTVTLKDLLGRAVQKLASAP